MSIKIEDSWKQLLISEFNKNYFKELISFVKSEYSSSICYPKGSQIFSAFDNCPINELKVVIIGQDPYHTPGVPNGLAFSVNKNAKLPPSLINIFRELESDLDVKNSNGDLSAWSRQGVLLLNTSLSVCAGLPASHSNIGWVNFTNAVIEEIQKRKNIIFLLWGKHAQKKKELINEHNFILEAAHPSPLSANNGFFGCGHFSKTNNLLTNLGIDPIDWQLE